MFTELLRYNGSIVREKGTEMTVSELIDRLSRLPQDAVVAFQDYEWSTMHIEEVHLDQHGRVVFVDYTGEYEGE